MRYTGSLTVLQSVETWAEAGTQHPALGRPQGSSGLASEPPPLQRTMCKGHVLC